MGHSPEFILWRDGTPENKAEFESAPNTVPYSEWKDGTRLINHRSGKCTVRGPIWAKGTTSEKFEIEFDNGQWGWAYNNGAYKSLD